jgi:hypothetical protein
MAGKICEIPDSIDGHPLHCAFATDCCNLRSHTTSVLSTWPALTCFDRVLPTIAEREPSHEQSSLQESSISPEAVVRHSEESFRLFAGVLGYK